MRDNRPTTSFADFMSDLAVAVVISLQTRDEATIAELASRLAELTEESNKADEQELAAYFGALHSLLTDDNVPAAAENLVDPYRAAYQRILQELERAPEHPSTDLSLTEWLVEITTVVAIAVRRGSDEDRAELDRALVGMAGQMGPEDTEFHDFVAALRAVARGEDSQEWTIRLRSPYREAFQGLLQLLAAEDPSDFALRAILDRVAHNTIMALHQEGPELRLAVAEALADLEARLPEEEPTTAPFRSLIVGAMALLLERQPPATVDSLPDPFAQAWHAILTASQ